MGLMEPGCKLEDFGRPAQPAVTNRLRCRARWCLSDIWCNLSSASCLACAWRIIIWFSLQKQIEHFLLFLVTLLFFLLRGADCFYIEFSIR
jgi:hypothetical protein